MKLTSIFELNQGQQITDEEIYQNQGPIPVLTGQNDVKGYWNESIVDEEDLPCITYPTKGNQGDAFVQTEHFNVNNTAVLIPYEEWRDKLKLQWIAYKLETIFLKVMTSKGGVSYLNRKIVEDVELEVPDKDIQKEELKFYRSISNLLNRVNKILSDIEELKEYSLALDQKEWGFWTLDNFLEYTSRNDELSKEGIYNRSHSLENADYIVTVLSGSFEGEYGKVPMEDSLNVVENRPCLHVITRGRAGEVRALKSGTYATNTNAMLLTIKEAMKQELGISNEEEEEKYLRFLEAVLQPYFSEYASSADLSVFPITKVIKEIEVPKIMFKDEVGEMAEHLMMVDRYQNILEEIQKELQGLKEKEIK